MIEMSPLTPGRTPPRSRRARRTRSTDSTSCGATEIAITRAVAIWWNAAGTLRSARFGLASAFAAPMQISSPASRPASTAV